jgi:hypothetical protein
MNEGGTTRAISLFVLLEGWRAFFYPGKQAVIYVDE